MNTFIQKLTQPSAEKIALYSEAKRLEEQADTNRQYASAAVQTFAATGRESCLVLEATHLAAAKRKENRARALIDAALAL